MALIASIDISIGASAKKLKQGLRNATGYLKRFGSFLSKFGQIAAAGLGVASAAFAGLAFAVNRSFSSIDELAKTADNMGIMTDTLEGLRHAASLAGVSTSDLDKTMEQFQRRTGEAAMGTGQAAKAFEALGLNAGTLAQMPIDERLGLVADALNGIENEAERAALSYQIFGRQGSSITALLRQGSEAIKDQTGFLEQFGLATSRGAASGVEVLNDTWTKFTAILGGVVNKIATEVAPLINGLVDWFTDGSGEAINFGEIIEAAFDIIGKAIGFVLDGFNAMRAVWLKTQEFIVRGIRLIVQGFEQVIKGINRLLEALDLGKISLDFVDALESELGATADRLGEGAAQSWNDAFNRTASRRFNEILQRNRLAAEAVEAEAASRALGGQPLATAAQTALRIGGGGAALALAGTQAAASAINRPAKEMERIAREQLAAAERTADGIDGLSTQLTNTEILRVQSIPGS